MFYFILVSSSSSSSSSDNDSDEDEQFTGFDEGLGDDLIGDDKDRQKLDQMTEKERELELYNRQERLEAMKIRKELGQKLQAERKKQSKKKEKSDKKHHHKSGSKEEDSDQYQNTIASRKSERKKGGDENKKSALDELKLKRTEKKEKEKIESSKKELEKIPAWISMFEAEHVKIRPRPAPSPPSPPSSPPSPPEPMKRDRLAFVVEWGNRQTNRQAKQEEKKTSQTK